MWGIITIFIEYLIVNSEVKVCVPDLWKTTLLSMAKFTLHSILDFVGLFMKIANKSG